MDPEVQQVYDAFFADSKIVLNLLLAIAEAEQRAGIELDEEQMAQLLEQIANDLRTGKIRKPYNG